MRSRKPKVWGRLTRGTCRSRTPSGPKRRAFFGVPIAYLFAITGYAQVLYVDPAHPSAKDFGRCESPCKTISYALTQLSPGDLLKIRAGTYRELLNFGKSGTRSDIVIEAENGAVIKGSDVVTGWETLGNGLFAKRGWSVSSQQVFVDGVPLQQIGGTIENGYPDKAGHPLHKVPGGFWPGRIAGDQTTLPPGSFYYDEAEKSLYVKPLKGTLGGKTVEVSVRPYLIFSDQSKPLTNVTFRGLTLMHSNTTATSNAAAVRLAGTRMKIDRVNVSWTDGLGLSILGDNNVISNSVANYNGCLGIGGGGKNNKYINNETSYNNYREFNKSWTGGGTKWAANKGLRDSEVIGHRALFNKGNGIWFDVAGSNNLIQDGVFAYNDFNGIHYEIIGGATIRNNIVYGNRERGIYCSNCWDSTIRYNLVASNGLEEIVVANGRKVSQTDRPHLLPKNNKVLNNIIAWPNTRALVLPHEGLNNASDGNMFVGETEPSYLLGWGPYAPANGLAAWQEQSGQDKNSWQKLAPLPSDLAAGLRQHKINLDWSALSVLASGLKLAEPAKRPGPRE